MLILMKCTGLVANYFLQLGDTKITSSFLGQKTFSKAQLTELYRN